MTSVVDYEIVFVSLYAWDVSLFSLCTEMAERVAKLQGGCLGDGRNVSQVVIAHPGNACHRTEIISKWKNASHVGKITLIIHFLCTVHILIQWSKLHPYQAIIHSRLGFRKWMEVDTNHVCFLIDTSFPYFTSFNRHLSKLFCQYDSPIILWESLKTIL